MSVFVEALSVIVRRRTLDSRYPGGSQEYLQRAIASTRLACSDNKLTSVSFLDREARNTWISRLDAFGIVHVDDNRCIDIACIDQQIGPSLPCDWISLRRHDDGFTYCWLAGTDPGDMAAPDDWTANQSRQLVRRGAAEVR